MERYWEKYRADDRYFPADQAVSLVYREFPRNAKFEHVLLKVCLLNDMYSTNIYATFLMARHIHGLRIDSRLRRADPGLVNDVADVTLGGSARRCYSFASKYCSWHKPQAYPIYDSFVDRLLWAYQQRDAFSVFRRKDLQDYPTYKRVLDDFRSAFGLKRLGLRKLDKFLWLYGKELFTRVD